MLAPEPEVAVRSIPSRAASTSEVDSGLSDGSFASRRRIKASNVWLTRDRHRSRSRQIKGVTPRGMAIGSRLISLDLTYLFCEIPYGEGGVVNVSVPTIIPSVVRRERSMATANPKSPILAVVHRDLKPGNVWLTGDGSVGGGSSPSQHSGSR